MYLTYIFFVYLLASISSPALCSLPPLQDLIDPETYPTNPKDSDSQRNLDASPEDTAFQQDLLYINSLMINTNLIGGWDSNSPQRPNKFENTQGLALVNYITEIITENDFRFDLFIYDGEYIDQDFLIITFDEYAPSLKADQFSRENSTLTLGNTMVFVQSATNKIYRTGAQLQCHVNSTIFFINTTTNLPFTVTYDHYEDKSNLGIQVYIESNECGINIMTSVLSLGGIADNSHVFGYVIFMASMAILQCAVCHTLTKSFETGVLNPRKVSVGTLRLLNTFDFYICLSNLGNFMDESGLMGLTALPFAFLALHYEFKLILIVVSSQTRLPSQDISKLSCANCIWMFASFFTIILSAFYEHAYFVYIAFGISQVPQIVQNALLNQRYRYNCWILGPLSLPKMIYLYYVLVYDENIMRMSPNPDLFMIIVVGYFAQLLVLTIQRRWPGLSKKEENFYRFYDATDKEFIGQDVCCICLEKLNEMHQEGKDNALLNVSSSTEAHGKTMISTPCNHHFHEVCLKDWLKLKYECPYCRNALPAMPGDDYDW